MVSEYLSAPVWPAYIAAAIALALAVWLLKVDFRHPSHRSFAAFLFLAAGDSVLGSMVQASTDVTVARYLQSVRLYWVLLSFVAVAWFLVAYLRARPAVAWSVRAVSASLAGVMLIPYMFDHAWVWTFGVYGVDPGIRYGPITYNLPVFSFVTWQVMQAVEYVALFFLARRFSRTRPGRHAHSLFLMTMGFLVLTAYASIRISLLYLLYPDIILNSDIPLVGSYSQLIIQGVFGTTTVVAAGIYLLRGRDAETKGQRAGAFVGHLLFAAVAALFSVTAYRGPIAGLMEGLVFLAVPILATYAILRHQLFDIDIKARFTVKASTLAGIFLAVGFAATEASTQFLGDTTGSTYVGIGATALLVFAISPLQRIADRLAHAAVPDAKPVVAMDADEKAMAYAEVVRMAWLDGTVTPAERRGMESARQRLGISVEDAHQVEQETVAGLA